MKSHLKCQGAEGHVCQRPTAELRRCVETGCDATPGTIWGPLWCPEHDEIRLDRIGASLEAIAEGLR